MLYLKKAKERIGKSKFKTRSPNACNKMQLEKAKNKKTIKKKPQEKSKNAFVLAFFVRFFGSEKMQKHARKKIRTKQQQKKKNKLFFVFSVAFCFCTFRICLFLFYSKVWFPGVVLVCFLLLFFKRVIYRIKLDRVDTTKYVSICQRNRQHTTASDSKGM